MPEAVTPAATPEAVTPAASLTAYEAKRKSTGVAYLLWLFLGLFGAHRLYASRGNSGWWLMGLHIGGWALIALAFFYGSSATTETYETAFGMSSMTNITVSNSGGIVAAIGQVMRGAAWLWWLIDIFLIPGLVRRSNSVLAAGLGLGALR